MQKAPGVYGASGYFIKPHWTDASAVACDHRQGDDPSLAPRCPIPKDKHALRSEFAPACRSRGQRPPRRTEVSRPRMNPDSAGIVLRQYRHSSGFPSCIPPPGKSNDWSSSLLKGELCPLRHEKAPSENRCFGALLDELTSTCVQWGYPHHLSQEDRSQFGVISALRIVPTGSKAPISSRRRVLGIPVEVTARKKDSYVPSILMLQK